MAISLTKCQGDALAVIAEIIEAEGVAPSRRELGAELDLRSTNSVHQLIVGLEDRGAIRRVPGRQRALEILVMPPPRIEYSIGLTAKARRYLAGGKTA